MAVPSVSPARSRNMALIRSKDTAPEIAVRRQLSAAGFRFRLHDPGTPGRPDLVIRNCKLAVFVDGCFWHGCPRHYTRPHVRRAYWDAKLRRNRDRRSRILRELASEGWTSVEIWECEVKAGPDHWLPRVARAVLH